MEDRPRTLSDDEFNSGLADLEEGRAPYSSSPEMLRRFGETIVAKLWEAANDKNEPQISS